MTPEKWEKVKKIFHAALDVSEAERKQFVESECIDDATLLSEVNSLFEAYGESDAFIESPAYQAISDLVEDTAMPSRVGQIVGSYEIEREIGRGGMGAVYLASRADKEFDKKVAVKLIKRGFDTEEIIRRFRYERQILAALEHTNITRLLDGGSTDDGLPYLVMDYVDGKPLTIYSNENKLSIKQRLNIFLQICSAVAYAHQNLVIHRDLKPSNVLVTAEGTPKLLDFGIARLIAQNGEIQTVERTVNAFHAMTPDYASPEQISGQPVTTTTDIYSLGVVLYELLTGHRPYRFKTNNADEIGRVLTETSPTKPSSICRLRGLNIEMDNAQSAASTLQGDLDNIVLMAMRKEAERRYTSVEQFAEDIRRYLDGRPVIAQDDTFTYRASKFIKRNKAGVAAGLGVAASLIGGLLVASREARIAARQRDRARKEARKAEKVNRFLQKMLASADPRAAGKDLRVIEMLRIAAESVETEFARQPEIAADLNTTIGLTYLSLGQIEEAEHHLKAALETRLDLFPRKSVEVALSQNNYGKLLQAKGSLKEAEPLYYESLDTFYRLEGRTNLDAADVLLNLGYLTILKGDNDEAVRLHEEALRIRREILGENHPDVARSLCELGNVLSVMGRYDLSEPLHRRAWKTLRENYGEDHPDIAVAITNMIAAILPNRPEEAEHLSHKVLAMRRKMLGEDHADVAWSLYNLAYVLINRNKYDKAEPFVRESLAKRGANLPDEHPVVASCYLLLGRTLMAKGSYEAAKDAFERCLELRLKTLPDDHWLLATTRSFLGECLVYLGEHKIGKNLLLENLDILRSKLGHDHQQTLQAEERVQNVNRFLKTKNLIDTA